MITQLTKNNNYYNIKNIIYYQFEYVFIFKIELINQFFKNELNYGKLFMTKIYI